MHINLYICKSTCTGEFLKPPIHWHLVTSMAKCTDGIILVSSHQYYFMHYHWNKENVTFVCMWGKVRMAGCHITMHTDRFTVETPRESVLFVIDQCSSQFLFGYQRHDLNLKSYNFCLFHFASFYDDFVWSVGLCYILGLHWWNLNNFWADGDRFLLCVNSTLILLPKSHISIWIFAKLFPM